LDGGVLEIWGRRLSFENQKLADRIAWDKKYINKHQDLIIIDLYFYTD
jgi:hypothetical protein